MRVVLHAEGSRDLGASGHVPPSEPIPEASLGAAHVLVRQCMEAVEVDAPTFEAPLRSARGRRLKGSDLLQPKKLLRALTWPRPERRPDLAIVLVDADGDLQRHQRLERTLEQRTQRVPAVAGVAVQELEAWLLADQSSVHAVLGRTHDPLPDLEAMSPGEAKPILESWLATDTTEAANAGPPRSASPSSATSKSSRGAVPHSPGSEGTSRRQSPRSAEQLYPRSRVESRQVAARRVAARRRS